MNFYNAQADLIFSIFSMTVSCILSGVIGYMLCQRKGEEKTVRTRLYYESLLRKKDKALGDFAMEAAGARELDEIDTESDWQGGTNEA